MAEMVIGEQTTLEEMGGARMHATVSGCGDNLAVDDADAIEQARAVLSYLPRTWKEAPPVYEPVGADPASSTADMVPDRRHPGLRHARRDRRPRRRRELLRGEAAVRARADRRASACSTASRSGSWPTTRWQLGGALFVDSADKAARFIWWCDAFNVPLVFLADVPGFMIGTQVERQGIIRHGAKMVTAVSEATVPKISVIVRKAYGAGLYAMSGPAFEPEATLALPTAKIAVMGPEAAVNAVFANKIAAIEDPAEREAFVAEQRKLYEEDVDLYRLASELVIDAVVDFGDLRGELVRRLTMAEGKDRSFSDRRHGVPPV